MRPATLLVAAVAVLSAPTPAAAHAQAHPPIPPPGRTLVMVGQDPNSIDDYVRESATTPAGLMSYVFLEQSPADFSAHLAGIKAEADKYPGSAVQLGTTMGYSSFWSATNGNPQPPGALQVTQGAYDEQIKLLAAWLKQLQHTAYVRLGYEFDLLGGQWGPPAQYKAAYRYIVDRLRKAGVRNALYVWHSSGAYFKTLDWSGPVGLAGTIDYTPGDQADPVLEAVAGAPRVGGGDLQPIGDYYPGRRYVDLFAISYWDDAYGFGRSSPRARALYRQREQEILDQAKALGLPLMIGESTPAYIGFGKHADSLEWLKNYFALIERNDMRALSLIVPNWHDIDNGYWAQAYWNGYWPDARVQHFADTRAAWLAKLAEPRYR